ncbi:hypothetical protein [Nitriliruptor alkaliphilus]|uniref:hypothetical protein n=1 Tax=Nitriliruptor alkaliphilus TaxID=427918 RepID=UPI0006973347|nr:hypothetical protein [Nitriliruptor alkaliphilus]
MRPGGHHAGSHREAGAAAAEYVAGIALVALLIGTLGTATDIGTAAFESVRAGFCRIVLAVDASMPCDPTPGGGTDPHDDFRPDRCDVFTVDHDGEVRLDVLFFDVSSGLTFSRTERSDGNTEFAVVDRSGAGIAAEAPGLEVELGPLLELDVGAEARLGLTLQDGQSWVVPTADADDFQNDLIKRTAVDQTVGRVPLVGGWAADQVGGWITDVPDPNVRFVAAGAEADLSASATLSAAGLDIAGAEAGAGAMVELGVEIDRSGPESEWTDTTYLLAELNANGKIGVLPASVEGDIGVSTVVKVERSPDGELRAIELVNTTTGDLSVNLGFDQDLDTLLVGASSSDHLVESTRVELNDAADRDIGQRWLRTIGQDGGDFVELADRAGITTVTRHQGDRIDLAAGGKISFVAKAGLRGEGSRTESRVIDAAFRGAPDASGHRPLIEFTDCLAAAG